MKKCIPKQRNPTDGPDYVSLYGFRGIDARASYMSPSEFTQWWLPVRLKAPKQGYPFTRWGEDADRERPEPGIDYFRGAIEVETR